MFLYSRLLLNLVFSKIFPILNFNHRCISWYARELFNGIQDFLFHRYTDLAEEKNMILGQNLFTNLKNHVFNIKLILNSEVNVICMVATQNFKLKIASNRAF